MRQSCGLPRTGAPRSPERERCCRGAAEALVEGFGATGSCHEDTGVTIEVGGPQCPAGPQKNPWCYDCHSVINKAVLKPELKVSDLILRVQCYSVFSLQENNVFIG